MKLLSIFLIAVLASATQAQNFASADEIDSFVDDFFEKVWEKLFYSRNHFSPRCLNLKINSGDTDDIYDYSEAGRTFKPAYQFMEACENLTSKSDEGLANQIKDCLKREYL